MVGPVGSGHSHRPPAPDQSAQAPQDISVAGCSDLQIAPRDTLDLPSMSFSSSGTATLQPGNVLQISENGSNVAINLDPNQDFTGFFFQLASDSSSGTLISEAVRTQPPSGLTLAPASDTGLQGDNITTATRPIIRGTGVPGDGVTLCDGATVIGSSPVFSDGTWGVFPSLLAPGVHALTAIESDVPGHVSGPSAALLLSIMVPPVF